MCTTTGDALEMARVASGCSFRPSPSHSHWRRSLPSSPSLYCTTNLLRKRKASSLLVCAASSAVGPSISRQKLTLSVGVHQIPHPNKVERGGEDAFFVNDYSGGVIGVADGVSGWAEKNIDPALFSRELMVNASSFVNDEEVNYDPQMLLKKAHAANTYMGSATVIVAMLESDGTLKIANVGDCGLRVIRKGKIIFLTSPVEHYFDCPYQLSSEEVTQTYLDAVVSSVKLLEGDIIVMGSDGLFDNVYDQEIVSTVTTENLGNVSQTAKLMANLASDHSKDTSFESPYSIEARSRGFDLPSWKKFLGQKLTGGKLDDITVIVAQVERSKDVPT